ncbi:MAG: hypothetical protein FJW85_03270 [Actinobacteria bacterium]|nr:hypothetical protein [Actinomycetota bacterium]
MGSRSSVVVAVLVAAAAATATSPVALATAFWVGGGAIAAGLRAGAPTYSVAGLLIVVAAALVVTSWATIPGIVRGRRRPAVVALVAVIAMGALALTRAWQVTVASWAPRSVALAAFAIAILALLVHIARARAPRGPVVGVGPAVAGVLGAYVLVAAVAVLPGTAIPQFPRPPWVPEMQEGVAAGAPIVAAPAPQNPSLAPGEWATIHNDSWMTDSYSAARLPDPAGFDVRSFFAGGDCASLLWNDRGEIVAVCVSPTEVRAYVLDPRTLEPRAERRLAARALAADALTNFSGGGYAVLDSSQRLVTPLPGGVIGRFDARDLVPVDEFDVSSALQPGEGITSVIPDWSGLLWFVGREGTVGALDPATGSARSLVSGPGDSPVDIENSFAVVEGGAYVVTGAELLRLSIVAGAPVVDWRLPYDRGTRLKPGQTSRASGTTPTVFGEGGRYVAITDNADPRMHVVVYDVSGPVPVEHCAVPVFGDGMSATENSLIALGDSLVVESNYGYSVTAVAGGHSTVPGLARVDVTDAGCSPAWESDDITIPSLVSKGTIADGAVLTYTKEPSALGTDAWWFTAVDAQSGEVRWRRLAGVGPMLNNHYAAGYLSPDGSVYVGTISGIVALIPPG